MNLEPVFEAPVLVQVHLAAALAAVGLGVVQMFVPRGRTVHRVMGWTWAVVFAVAVASSLALQGQVPGLPHLGPFSTIHLFTAAALVALPAGIWAARTRRVLLHRALMTGMFAGLLLTAGAFSLAPGRVLHRAVTEAAPALASVAPAGPSITAE